MDEQTDADGERLVGSERVLAVLVEVAAHPEGVTLDELAHTLSSPKPTIHRALASLRKARLVDQIGRGVYLLGDEFLRLAFRNHDARPDAARIEPVLRALAEEYGETAHYAVLDGAEVVYRSKVDPPTGAVRLTSTIGGRNPAYRTAVGKVLLASVVGTEAELAKRLAGVAFERSTPHTVATVARLWTELEATRANGFAVDDQENELGVNCVALPVHLDGSPSPTGSISVSGLAFRAPIDVLVAAVPRIRATIEQHLGARANG